MSPSPINRQNRAKGRNYNAAWAAILRMARSGSSWSGRERNGFFLNCGSGAPVFANASAVSGLDFPDDGRAVALVDWDRDGDLDCWFRNRTAPRLRLMRNNTISEGGGPVNSITFRLVGTRCNRDAIGARVMLTTSDGLTGTSSVRAGEGYLSQSGKELFFGLGSRENFVRSVEVLWPGGGREAFEGVETGGRYVLTQGEGKATRLDRHADDSVLRAGALSPLEGGVALAAPLPARVPAPALRYTERPGGAFRSLAVGTKPLLLMLWASWCPNCVRELTELAGKQEILAEAGIDVLALSLDGRDAKTTGEANAAETTLREIGFPYPAGYAAPELPDAVRQFHDALFDHHVPFSIPFSLLLTPKRDVIAFYRGAVTPEALGADARRLMRPDSPESLRSASLPFAGSWFTKAATEFDVAQMMGRKLRPHLPGEAARYLEKASVASSSKSRARSLRLEAAAIHHQLGRESAQARELEAAGKHFEKALELNPHAPETLHDFGALLANQGELERAELLFVRALELRPDYELARKNLELVRSLRDPSREEPGEDRE